MHDEAGPHYVEMVENTARGHQFLKKYFGIAPKGTWQIDPFGHSNTQGWLIGQYAGLQFLYFGRMDYADFTVRSVTPVTMGRGPCCVEVGMAIDASVLDLRHTHP